MIRRKRSVNSGIITVSGIVSHSSCVLRSVQLKSDLSHACTAKVYNAQALIPAQQIKQFDIAAGGVSAGQDNIDQPCQLGLYLDLSGTGAYAIVEYDVFV